MARRCRDRQWFMSRLFAPLPPCLRLFLLVSLLYVVLIPFARWLHNTFPLLYLDIYPIWFKSRIIAKPHPIHPLQIVCFHLPLQFTHSFPSMIVHSPF